jgi:hypothetical protein
MFIRLAAAGAILFTAFTWSVGAEATPGTLRLAQATPGSCQGFQDMCARRCPQWAPNDPKCVADHCTPKLLECRRTGCWQEGQRFGGALTCNLRR